VHRSGVGTPRLLGPRARGVGDWIGRMIGFRPDVVVNNACRSRSARRRRGLLRGRFVTGASIHLSRPSRGLSRASGRTPSEGSPSRGAAAVASQPLAAASAAALAEEAACLDQEQARTEAERLPDQDQTEAHRVAAALWRCARERPRLRCTPSTLLCDHALTSPPADPANSSPRVGLYGSQRSRSC
jgi:hypothetical protein